MLFAFYRFEPIDYGCGVFPLVEVAFLRDCAVDAVEDLFADFAYLGLRGIDESAGRFVCEVQLVVLKCYESVFVGCSHAKHRNSIELSKHIWTLKDNNIEHFISWRILSSLSPYNSLSKRCNFCLKEKFLISFLGFLPSK